MSASAAEGAEMRPAAAALRGRLDGQRVVVIGGSAGIGFETARLARAEGAGVILTARNPDPLERAGRSLEASRTAAFDAADPAALAGFFESLDGPVDHLMLTAGRPQYGTLQEIGVEKARDALSEHTVLALEVAAHAAARVRPGGTLLLMSGTGGRRAGAGLAIASAVTAATPALARSLALEIAPVRVNVIAPGFVDTPLSASILGGDLERRREELRTTLPIRRVVGPEDVAALAVHIMLNEALTGATFDIDGGQQLLA
jgi:NAD(P)-dependent dehydrogenase (short-subunit alcohol dehydrogenase family)